METRHEIILNVTNEEENTLRTLLGKMRQMEEERSRAKAYRYKQFLPKNSQRSVNAKRINTYYHEHILISEAPGCQIPHKQLMLHWAAIYDVIACDTGITRDPHNLGELIFYGPDFDHFLIDYCHIAYNESGNPRGRYREVGDIWKRYHTLWTSAGTSTISANEEKQLELFTTYRKTFSKLYHSAEDRASWRSSEVPGEFS